MHHLTRSFLPRVYRIKIQGQITANLTQTIANKLQAWPYYPEALLVTINSSGGSVTQAKNIADLLKVYSNRLNIPVITFAEDGCLGSANVILTSGVKCYASPFSMVGDFGHYWRRIWLSKLANKYQLKQEYLQASTNQVKLNPLEELSKESEEWIRKHSYALEADIKSAILQNRGKTFQKHGLSKEEVEDKIFKVGVDNPERWVKYGLLDGFKTFDQQISTIKLRKNNAFLIRKFDRQKLNDKTKYNDSFANSV